MRATSKSSPQSTINNQQSTIALFLALALASPTIAQDPEPHHAATNALIANHYQIEDLPLPPGLSAEVGGLDFTPSGKLVACFHHGELYVFDLETSRWTLFAQGLHDPLGLVAVSDTEIIVLQRGELTRLTDTDGDGAADLYTTISEAFGVSGNYHEFPFGPAVAPDGSYYLALGHASNGSGPTVQYEVRGEVNPLANPATSKYALVPWRGWAVRIDPATGAITPFADGLKEPNGIGFDPQGRLFAVDNQGRMVATSCVFLLEPGKFYGHPGSLVWRDDELRATQDPWTMPLDYLDSIRSHAAVLIPHGSMANSPSQPLWDTTGGRFGPFEGQMFLGEMNLPRLLRVMLDEVDGHTQGAVTTFYDGGGLHMGNNRLAFGPDGALYIGQTQRVGKWVGGSGIQRLVYTGNPPPDVLSMNLTPTGFKLTFTLPVDPAAASKPANYRFFRYRYLYHHEYGSPQIDRTEIAPTSAAVSDDGRTVTLTLPPDSFRLHHVFELHLQNLRAAQTGEPVINTFLAYTVNRLHLD